MKILGIDTSAVSCSVAVCEVGETQKVIASGSINTKLTHSQTLMPLLEQVLGNAAADVNSIDAFAVSAGPGSFTGLRIGISSVKGMAYAAGRPCRAVSTLLALAYNLSAYDGIVCPVMDARCNQVYNAMFEIKDGKVSRLCEDRALFIPDLAEEIKQKYADRKIILCGDGTELCYNKLGCDNVMPAPAAVRFQSGAGVAFAAEECEDISAASLMPTYLRLPQAERERLAKEKAQENKS